ncbi:glycosyltransferase [Flavobacterium sp. Fl-77]|uniref:Glycosyltransferase n=1 Tax=Flavobacterium flavipigmentatum TaxID=2893884 RepID=A0AAJ2VY04_9FLAO|nr:MULTISPECIES: glycosyltransferase [unclassified Flavobacterium]MDX6182207.1 glycosyltransferase [Flavobacterium sp. Fl-33]MDX6185880.1 glycosyltransferase [Flavobacterium sp. Fl-77]UFH39058.1 glycosyltransferase [Flavobacterium sp. F-70]
MPKLLQISIEVNSGSVGKIAEQIGETVLEEGWLSYITYARNINPSKSEVIKIGNKFDLYEHGLETRIFDNHCFSSRSATKNLIKTIDQIDPDIIHLHHLHGYFINVEILFIYLKKRATPVVWTFHDCWSFTGHCAYFDFVGCEKWKTECHHCEQKNEYPKSLFFDRSRKNYRDKKRIFNSLNNLTIVPVSYWLAEKVKDSFLMDYTCQVIQNGIDLNTFYIKNSRNTVNKMYPIKNKFVILGVASTWEKRKGLDEFVKLSELINNEVYTIILVGLSSIQISKLPKTIIGIERTENLGQLVDLYSAADVFVNPTFEDTYPTTNLESMACGTPVITYRTGGSIESVNDNTGIVIDKGDVSELVKAIEKIKNNGKGFYQNNCREHSVKNFDKKIKFMDYYKLYEEILKNNSNEKQ